jgi:hypothetical protein
MPKGFCDREFIEMRTRNMRKIKVMAFVVCLAMLVATGATHVEARRATRPQQVTRSLAASSGLTPDKGKFRIVLNGQPVGNEEFEISSSGSNWTARGSTTAQIPGGMEIKASGQLKLSSDGTPHRYEWSAQAQKKATGAVDFTNGTAKCSANLGGTSPMMKDFKFDSPRVAVLDNNLYYQYAILAQVYDWKAGGKQTFPVLIPQDMTPGSISVESTGPQAVENASLEGLKVSSTDLEILIYLDVNHHMVRLEVPSSKVVIQRE